MRTRGLLVLIAFAVGCDAAEPSGSGADTVGPPVGAAEPTSMGTGQTPVSLQGPAREVTVPNPSAFGHGGTFDRRAYEAERWTRYYAGRRSEGTGRGEVPRHRSHRDGE